MKTKELYKDSNIFWGDAFDRVVTYIYTQKQKDNLKSFVICGTQPHVGTTTIAISLAIALADSGWKTLLIDGDMRKKTGSKRLDSEDDMGLAEYLDGIIDQDEAIYKTNYPQLFYIPSGNASDNVVSRVCSQRMREFVIDAEKEYDYVIVDAPALSTAVDACALANSVSSVILVTAQQEGYTKKAIRYAKTQLDQMNANILGIIVNKVEEFEYKRVVENYDYFSKKKYLTTPRRRR